MRARVGWQRLKSAASELGCGARWVVVVMARVRGRAVGCGDVGLSARGRVGRCDLARRMR